MRKILDFDGAVEETGIAPNVFRRLLNNRDNPPPHLRPTPRVTLFDSDELKAWMDAWERNK